MQTQKIQYLRPAKKRYALGNNWKQIHLPLAHELYYGHNHEAIESIGNIYIFNTISPNNDLFEISIELQYPLYMKGGRQVQKVEMNRKLSFDPIIDSFEIITTSGEGLQQKVGKVSGISPNNIKYERFIKENKEENRLRVQNTIRIANAALEEKEKKREKGFEKEIKKRFNLNEQELEFWRSKQADDEENILTDEDMTDFEIGLVLGNEMIDSMVESNSNDIELICNIAGISDVFGILSCGLIPCLKHILKFYDAHNPKEVKLVRNQYQRTIDYNEDVLSAEEAILIANAMDWITVANCTAACSQTTSFINHSQKNDRENGLRPEQIEKRKKAEESKNFIDLEAYSPEGVIEKRRNEKQEKILEQQELGFTKKEYEMYCRFKKRERYRCSSNNSGE